MKRIHPFVNQYLGRLLSLTVNATVYITVAGRTAIAQTCHHCSYLAAKRWREAGSSITSAKISNGGAFTPPQPSSEIVWLPADVGVIPIRACRTNTDITQRSEGQTRID